MQGAYGVRDVHRSIGHAYGCRLCVELLMLFCPTETEHDGILLYYCDRMSLFERIGRSAS